MHHRLITRKEATPKALSNRGDGVVAVDLTDVPEPEPASSEALVEAERSPQSRGAAADGSATRRLATRSKTWRAL